MNKIYLGADHAGFERKEVVKTYLADKGYTITDFGAKEMNPEDDYPDFAHSVAEAVATDGEKGLLFCGNAEGVCIVANKTDGVRAALGYSIDSVVSSRKDDDTNILCLPGRSFTDEEVIAMVEAWLETEFSGAERHKRRLDKITKIEEDN